MIKKMLKKKKEREEQGIEKHGDKKVYSEE